jgi:hypothetical protein
MGIVDEVILFQEVDRDREFVDGICGMGWMGLSSMRRRFVGRWTEDWNFHRSPLRNI